MGRPRWDSPPGRSSRRSSLTSPEPAAVDQDDDEPKRLYADVAAHSGLRWRTAAAGAAAAGLLGARLGWDPALLFGLYLVPVCVALAVVDWHTRYLPTRLIAPSYAVVGALVLLAWALTGDTTALVRSLSAGWPSFVFFFVQWFIYPRGFGYGDVRLSGLLGMALGWLGWVPLVLGVFGGLVLGAVGRRAPDAAAGVSTPALPVRAVHGARCHCWEQRSPTSSRLRTPPSCTRR